MKQSDSLFHLIKSLTRSEKRYFKLSLAGFQGQDKKHYLSLFDAMETQKVYDEKALKLKFKKVHYFKHFSRIKNYLYRQILKKLRNFYDESTTEIKLNNYLSEIEILFNKGLFAECKALIQRAKTLAIKLEKFPWLQQLMELEINLAMHTSDIKQLRLLKQKSFSEKEAVLAKCAELNELNRLYIESRLFTKQQGRAMTRADGRRFDLIMNRPIMKGPLKSFRAEFFRLGIYINCSYFLGDGEATYYHTEKMAHLIESSLVAQEEMKEDVARYITIVIAFLNMCIKTHRYAEAEKQLVKLKEIIKKRGDKMDIPEQMACLNSEMNVLEMNCNFDKAALLAQRINELLEKHNDKIDSENKLVILFNLSRVYLYNKDFKNTQFFLQKILNYPDQNIRPNVQRSAHIFNLLVQFEQQEYLHLRYVLRSTYRYLLKNKDLYKSETVILDFLHKAISVSSQKELLTEFGKIKKKLLNLRNEPFERNFMPNFPLIDWIESKIQKKSLAEILKENYSKGLEKGADGVIISPA